MLHCPHYPKWRQTIGLKEWLGVGKKKPEVKEPEVIGKVISAGELQKSRDEAAKTVETQIAELEAKLQDPSILRLEKDIAQRNVGRAT